MAQYQTEISLSTRGNAEMIDLTERVASALAQGEIENGIGCLFVPGSTCGITTIEFEPGCVADFRRLFDEIAAEKREYEHHLRWGDGNGHSHVRAALLGPSFSFPIQNKEPQLGTWQQIVLVDFDNRARDRRVLLQVVG